MEYTVPAVTVRIVLQAIKEVSANHYTDLLQQANLGRFIAQLPPEDWQAVATGAELTHLYATIYKYLGEAPTRLFLRNYGRQTPALIVPDPAFQEMLVQAPTVPPAQRVRWFVDGLARVTRPYWAATEVSEDAQAVYLTMDFCPVCAEIQGTTAPICSDGESFCGTLARRALGRRVRVVEIACVAMGDAHCKYAFYKA